MSKIYRNHRLVGYRLLVEYAEGSSDHTGTAEVRGECTTVIELSVSVQILPDYGIERRSGRYGDQGTQLDPEWQVHDSAKKDKMPNVIGGSPVIESKYRKARPS